MNLNLYAGFSYNMNEYINFICEHFFMIWELY